MKKKNTSIDIFFKNGEKNPTINTGKSFGKVLNQNNSS